jgi:hypothetical protein
MWPRNTASMGALDARELARRSRVAEAYGDSLLSVLSCLSVQTSPTPVTSSFVRVRVRASTRAKPYPVHLENIHMGIKEKGMGVHLRGGCREGGAQMMHPSIAHLVLKHWKLESDTQFSRVRVIFFCAPALVLREVGTDSGAVSCRQSSGWLRGDASLRR